MSTRVSSMPGTSLGAMPGWLMGAPIEIGATTLGPSLGDLLGFGLAPRRTA